MYRLTNYRPGDAFLLIAAKEHLLLAVLFVVSFVILYFLVSSNFFNSIPTSSTHSILALLSHLCTLTIMLYVNFIVSTYHASLALPLCFT